MPTFRCPLACTTFGLLRSFLRLSFRAWLRLVGSRACFGCCGLARGGVPQALGPVVGVPLRPLSCRVVPCFAPLCALGCRRAWLVGGGCALFAPWLFALRFGSAVCSSHVAFVMCALRCGSLGPWRLFLFPPFGPLPFGPVFRFRAKLTLAMVAKFATIWLERLFFLAAVSQGTCSLRMHARHLAVIRLVLLPSSFSS